MALSGQCTSAAEVELLLEEGEERQRALRVKGWPWSRPACGALAALAAVAVLLCVHPGTSSAGGPRAPRGVVELSSKGAGEAGHAEAAAPTEAPHKSAVAAQTEKPRAAEEAEDKNVLEQHKAGVRHRDGDAHPAPVCTTGEANCNATQCCADPGMQCYEQDGEYAQCRESCTPGPDPTHWDGKWWTCAELGERTAGNHSCSAPGEDCRHTRCCTHVNTQCFEKDAGWATCKSECTPGGPDLADANPDPWTCEKLGPWRSGAMPWVGSECAADGEDCRSKKCCKDAGHQCYSQSEYWAQCRPSCTPGKDPVRFWEPEWSCNTSGTRTPEGGFLVPGKVSKWVPEKCVGLGEDCTKSKCCKAVGHVCYEKNEDWAMCMEQCTEGVHAEDGNATWSCKQLGPVSLGLATKGYPSIFCWSLMRTTGYEMGLMQNALGKGAGIFACDEFSVLSTDAPTELGSLPDGGGKVTTVQVPPAEITTSQDGTSGNSKLFINCWDAIVADGRWRNHAWMVKVDPDAVVLPDRVRNHLAPHVNENVYVVNCNKFPSSPNFPMMYGALEIFSVKAIDVYARNKGLCFSDMGSMLPRWGEDYFMTHCLDHIGVGRIADFGSLGDMMCTGANCGDYWVASFHPFKDVASWNSCFDTATR